MRAAPTRPQAFEISNRRRGHQLPVLQIIFPSSHPNWTSRAEDLRFLIRLSAVLGPGDSTARTFDESDVDGYKC